MHKEADGGKLTSEGEYQHEEKGLEDKPAQRVEHASSWGLNEEGLKPRGQLSGLILGEHQESRKEGGDQ